VVGVFSIQGTGDDTSVTYDSVTMNAVPYTGADTDTEPGFIRVYFLDNVGSGAKTVLVNRVNNATEMIGFCATVTAASACEVYNAGIITKGGSTSNTGASTSGTGTGTGGEHTVDDGSPGTDSQRYQWYYTGLPTPPGAGANSTSLNVHDFTSFGVAHYSETTPGQGGRSVGAAAGSSDDRASVSLAVREVPAPAGPVSGWYGTSAGW
jgi:hypothetical protein